MHTIVVGVDGSEASLRALTYGAGLVETMNDAQLVVAHSRWFAPLWFPPTGQEEFGDYLNRVEEYARDATDTEMEHRSIEWKFVARAGEPSDVLHEIAQETEAMMIVVGRRGWSTLRELIMGSVSNRLVHHERDRVMLVP
jgi:nucleotide-binding universal stress UspA family protein